MNRSLERDSDGHMRVVKDGRGDKGQKKRVLGIALTLAVAAIAISGIGVALAGGDQNQLTHGEDDGYYDENNCNPYEDIPFPGEDVQNRTGVA